ncbi:MAG TPA: SusC/RagA family TonB-linked outer membrane protein [Gemmatimonadaceae bacterium]
MRVAILPLAALLVAATAEMARAQSAVITGKVTTEQGTAVAGANVFIKELGVGTTTNQAGSFSLSIAQTKTPPQRVVITARFIGFVPLDHPLTLTSGAHVENFTLKSDPFHLDQVVVTGVADSTSARNLTFSIAQITDQQIKDVPAANPIEALAGKVAGAKIETGVGNPGGTPAIRLRGSTSLQVGGSQPMVIIDGVIQGSAGGNNGFTIADIDAQDIESIEILKGAAGASFYGSNAANGVINITTKRGRGLTENHVTVTARTEYGQSDIGHWIDLAHASRDQFNSDGTIQLASNGNPVVNTSGFDDTPFPTSGPNRFRNQLQEWLGNNGYYNNNVQVGLRRGNTNFNTSYSSDHNGGVLPFRKGQFKQNARLNVDQGISDKLDMSASMTYGIQHNDYLPNSTTGWFALMQAPQMLDLAHPNPTVDSTTLYFPLLPKWASPSARGDPLYQLANEGLDYRRERIIGSLAGHYRPTNWFRVDANYGTDRLNATTQTYDPRGYLSSSGVPGNGSLTQAAGNNVATNSQIRGTATKLWKDLLSTSSLAYQLESEVDNNNQAQGTKLVVNEVPDLAALDPSQLTVQSAHQVLRTTDYMFSQSLALKDRYIVDGLYRRDGSSLFGPNSRWSDFYRVSGAYRLSEDFHIPGVQDLKLHAARGTAGLRPGYNYQYETYTISNGTFSKNTLGNKNLRPAILTENEYGINAQILDRFNAELTYADRTTKDAFLQVPLSLAASGGFNSQWQNAATIGSKTLEGSLQTRVLDRKDFSYDLTFTADHTTQQILTMNHAPFRVAADNAQGQNAFWYQAGKPLGVIYGNQFVRSFAQLKDNPANASAVESDYVVNPLGYLVKKSLRGTINEQPILYVDKAGNSNFIIGDVNPKLNYGISNDFKIRAFAVHALFDGQAGGKIYNFSKQWMFQDLRSGDMDQSGKAQDQKVAESFYTLGLYNNLVADDYFVEDGSYLKLRELSVAYNIPERLLPKIGLGRASGVKIAFIGRNLYTWTKYSGFDPDVTSGSDFNYRIDGFKYPAFRTFTGQFEISF